MEFDLTFSYQRQKKRGRKDYIHPPVVEPQLIISCDTQTGSNGPDIRKGKFIAPKQIYKVIDKRQTQQKQMADGAAQRHIIRKQLDKQVHRQGTQHIEEQHEIVCSWKVLRFKDQILDTEDTEHCPQHKQDQRP